MFHSSWPIDPNAYFPTAIGKNRHQAQARRNEVITTLTNYLIWAKRP